MATKSKARKPTARKQQSELVAYLTRYPMFVVVVTDLDGKQEFRKPFLTAVEASKYVGGFNSSMAECGKFAEARRLDLRLVTCSDVKLTAADVAAQAAKFPQNQRSGKAAGGR